MPKWFRPTFITAGIIAGLYAPFELTRVLLDLKAGYIPIIPYDGYVFIDYGEEK